MASGKILEPLYLNEKMTLNAAAYLFGGVTKTLSVTESGGEENEAGGKVNIWKFLNLSGNTKSSLETINQSQKEYTKAAVHMEVVDELKKNGQLVECNLSDLALFRDNRGKYIQFEGILKPIDFHSLVDTLLNISPVAEPLLALWDNNHTHGGKHSKGQNMTSNPSIVPSIKKFIEPIKKLLETIQGDYLRSKQVVFGVWTTESDSRLIGLATIDIEDLDSVVIKTRLDNGHFTIIGKIQRYYHEGESINLFQGTTLLPLFQKFEKLMEFSSKDAKDRLESMASPEEGGSAEIWMNSVKSSLAYEGFIKTIETAKEKINPFLQVTIEGPTFQIACMSICI